MSNIKIDQLSFGFDTQNHLLFDQADLVIDTQWKLGLIGRNGRGKLLYSNYCKTNCLIADYHPSASIRLLSSTSGRSATTNL